MTMVPHCLVYHGLKFAFVLMIAEQKLACCTCTMCKHGYPMTHYTCGLLLTCLPKEHHQCLAHCTACVLTDVGRLIACSRCWQTLKCCTAYDIAQRLHTNYLRQQKVDYDMQLAIPAAAATTLLIGIDNSVH